MSIALTESPLREIRLPDALLRALQPTDRRLHMLAVQRLLRELDHHFTSTRKLSEACGQLEITLLPWYRARKAASDGGVAKIERLIEFLPRLDAVTGDPKESGLWLVAAHYGFEPAPNSHVWNRRTPAGVLHSGEGREDEIIALAIDDFKQDSADHQDAIAVLGHELLPGGKIKLASFGLNNYSQEPSTRDAPYFHHRPRAGKTLAEKY
jgi:hypothetical protein